MSKLISPEKLKDIVEDADCCAEVFFTTSQGTRELLGWAKKLINTALEVQARSSDKEWIGNIKSLLDEWEEIKNTDLLVSELRRLR